MCLAGRKVHRKWAESARQMVSNRAPSERNKISRTCRKRAELGKQRCVCTSLYVVRLTRAQDQKYGFGGKKRYAKSNTTETADDMRGFHPKKMKMGAKGAKGAKGGAGKPVVRKAGSTRPSKAGKAPRPGKARRQKK